MKTALVTGANRGLGLETARQLLVRGFRVLLGSRTQSKGREAVEALRRAGLDNVETIVLDVTDPGSVKAAHREIEASTPALDVLINNAGVFGGFAQVPSSALNEVLRTAFETNFFGTVRVTQELLPLLRKSDAPRIVNVTTDLASLTLMSDPTYEFHTFQTAGYGPSKAALNAYTVALARELAGTAFKVNCVSPGYTATEFTGHRGKPVENGARVIVQYATLGADGPTGGFFREEGPAPW
jgi:NAD(P)-dependent dehydrogenase (short-subunit alcohol dehydrogenase family)